MSPRRSTSPVLRCGNVLITPHSAAFTQEAFDELRRTALLDVLHVLRGERPLFPVPG